MHVVSGTDASRSGSMPASPTTPCSPSRRSRAQRILSLRYSTPTTTVQVVVSVPADRAPDVLAAVGGRALAVVLHDGVESAAGGPTG